MRFIFLLEVAAIIAPFTGGAVRLVTAQTVAVQQAQRPSNSTDISGKWHFVYETEGGDRDMSADFRLEGDQVTGKYGTADVKGTYKDGNLDLAFPYVSEEAAITATLKMKGKLKEGKLAGTWEFSDYSGTFTATREK